MLKLEPVDHEHLHIESLGREHLSAIRELWQSKYRQVIKKHPCLPKSWLGDSPSFFQFLERHLKKDAGIVATYHDNVIGYMVYDLFDFHGEKTGFFPIMSHAVDADYPLVTYSRMYTHLSQVLVDQGCLNHVMTFFACDQELQTFLFELGFGLYVVDAYRDLQNIPPDTTANDALVRQATREDIDGLFALVRETETYYPQAPLFLKYKCNNRAEVLNILASPNQAMFIAEANCEMIGFMIIRRYDDEDVITLCDPTTALTAPVGAYIKQAYRGQGIGKRLLREAITWANQQGVTNIHVDYESANYHGNQFWPTYFTPILYSVKRRLNNDIESQQDKVTE